MVQIIRDILVIKICICYRMLRIALVSKQRMLLVSQILHLRIHSRDRSDEFLEAHIVALLILGALAFLVAVSRQGLGFDDGYLLELVCEVDLQTVIHL